MITLVKKHIFYPFSTYGTSLKSHMPSADDSYIVFQTYFQTFVKDFFSSFSPLWLIFSFVVPFLPFVLFMYFTNAKSEHGTIAVVERYANNNNKDREIMRWCVWVHVWYPWSRSNCFFFREVGWKMRELPLLLPTCGSAWDLFHFESSLYTVCSFSPHTGHQCSEIPNTTFFKNIDKNVIKHCRFSCSICVLGSLKSLIIMFRICYRWWVEWLARARFRARHYRLI